MNTITPEQQKNRDELLAWLDAGAPEMPNTKYGKPIIGFRMTNFALHTICGTVCCMAGFLLRNTPEDSIDNSLTSTAGRLIGVVDPMSCERLFIPSSMLSDVIHTSDTHWAAACLRHYFKTGVVDWDGTKP